MATIARALDQPHQLTEQGQQPSTRLDDYRTGAAIVFNNLSKDIGIDLHLLLNNAYDALLRKSFAARFRSNVIGD